MRVPDLGPLRKALLAVMLLLSLAGQAHAYIGPGAGLEFVSYALSLAIFVMAALSSVLMWPIYRIIRWLRGPSEKDVTTNPPETRGAAERTIDPVRAKDAPFH